MKRLLLSLFLFIPFALQLSAQSTPPPPTGDWVYTDCGCSGKINLKIYNGLYAGYGAQEVPNNKEESLGAVTVANLNDTDGDGSIDNIDNSVVATAAGRDEVDLMKLVIEKTGTFAPSCTTVVLTATGSVAFWQNSTKQTPALLTIPLTDLPKTIWVEATNVSAAKRDIEIVAKVNGTEHDKVKATAIWVNYTSRYIIRAGAGANNPSPGGLGIDDANLVPLIDNLFIALDGSRYGLGTLGVVPGGAEDGGIGGRILLKFTLAPVNIETELGAFGIKYDITRQINEVKTSMGYNSGAPFTTTMEAFPTQKEMPNDDTVDSDEDNVPTSNEIFSFDAPSNVGPHILPSGDYFTPTQAFLKREIQFREFVRVSFGAQPTGESVLGSACSNFTNWSVNYTAKSALHNPGGDPYTITNNYYSQLNAVPAVAQPRRLLGNGTGAINTALGAGAHTCVYLLVLDAAGTSWTVTRKEAAGSTNLGNFPIVGNTWTINDAGLATITITQNPAAAYTAGTVLSIPILTTNIINNSIN